MTCKNRKGINLHLPIILHMNSFPNQMRWGYPWRNVLYVFTAHSLYPDGFLSTRAITGLKVFCITDFALKMRKCLVCLGIRLKQFMWLCLTGSKIYLPLKADWNKIQGKPTLIINIWGLHYADISFVEWRIYFCFLFWVKFSCLPSWGDPLFFECYHMFLNMLIIMLLFQIKKKRRSLNV